MAKKKRTPYRKRDVASRFTLSYGPDILQHAGPYIPATLTIQEGLAAQLSKESKPLPPPVAGQVLLDTGAQRTCISQLAAQEMGLRPTKRMTVYGAGGAHQTDVVPARLYISIEDRGIQTHLWWDMAFPVVPDLEAHGQHFGIRFEGVPARLIGLLGRDILRNATVTYNGKTGKVEVTFDRQWIRDRSVTPPVRPSSST